MDSYNFTCKRMIGISLFSLNTNSVMSGFYLDFSFTWFEGIIGLIWDLFTDWLLVLYSQGYIINFTARMKIYYNDLFLS